MSLDGVALFSHTTLFSRHGFLWRLFFVYSFGTENKKPQTWWFAVEALRELLSQLPKITINRDGNAQNNRGVDDVPFVDTGADFGALCCADRAVS